MPKKIKNQIKALFLLPFSFKTLDFLLVFSLIVTMLVGLSYNSVTVTAEDGYDDRKNSIEEALRSINEEMSKVDTHYEDPSLMEKNLEDQVQKIEEELESIEIAIKTSEMTNEELDKQITANEAKISQYDVEIIGLLKEIQRNNTKTSFQIVLSSRNIGEAIGRLRNVSDLRAEIVKKRDRLNFQQEELEKNRASKNTVVASLDQKRALLISKKESLDNLLAQTDGENEKYQELLARLEEDKQSLEAKIGEIDKEIEASKPRNSPTKCYFEDFGDLGVSKDYFGKPANGYITQRFHCRHDGVDIANRTGTPIYAVADGVVVDKGYLGGSFGYYITLKHSLPSGQTVFSLYAHMFRSGYVEIGQQVTKGQQVGGIGTTGYSTGPHLHFMLISDSYEKTGVQFCAYSGGINTKCFNPARFIGF
jgi:murein DD-endopeptidase MepM/ murein hydrolase activator NlpD